MTQKIGIFGTSGFAREVSDIARVAGYVPVFIARDEVEIAGFDFPYDVILEDEVPSSGLSAFSVGIGENNTRKKIATKYYKSLNFINLLHPSATFGNTQKEELQKGIGIIVCAGVRFTSNIKVGDFSIFNLNCTIGHDSIIDPYVNVAPGANISGNVHLMSGCWLGTGAVINQGSFNSKLTVGEATIIGSGAVVTKSCDANATYVGAPAKRIK